MERTLRVFKNRSRQKAERKNKKSLRHNLRRRKNKSTKLGRFSSKTRSENDKSKKVSNPKNWKEPRKKDTSH